VLAIDGPDLDRFVKAVGDALATKPAQTMLTPGIFDAFHSGTLKVDTVPGVTEVAQGVSAGELRNAAQAALYVTDGQRLLASSELGEKMFGPASVVIRARDFAELLRVAEHIEGQLTVTLQIDVVDYADAQRLLSVLERKAGRILASGFPTGVEVCYAMVHGGPFPSTSNSMFTSVGATAIDRFLRPVCYQDLPDVLLPDVLKEDNPLGVWRLVNGELDAPMNAANSGT
jgi:NADP-dependent aldehyde dehydrogenase